MNLNISNLNWPSLVSFLKYDVLWKIGLKKVESVKYEKDIKQDLPKIEADIPVQVESLSEEKLKTLPKKFRKQFQNRLEKGHLAFLSSVKGKFAGYVWASVGGEVYMTELEKREKVPHNKAYIYDVKVFPRFRDKKISKKMNANLLHFLKGKEVKRAYSYVLKGNTPSRNSFESLGFKPKKKISLLKIFSFKRYKESNV